MSYKIEANVFLRKIGLNHGFKLKGSGFDGTLLELLKEYDSSKVVNEDSVLPHVRYSMHQKNCPDCGNYGILQDEHGANRTCQCHY